MTMQSSGATAPAKNGHLPFKRIFVTGGSGYVGRNLIRHYTNHGVEVAALVRCDASEEVVRTPGAVPYRSDVLGKGLVAAMLGCGALVHAAANTDHGPSTALQQQVNELGTQRVLEAARFAGIRKVVHLSTESVLASGKPLVHVNETMPLPRKFAGGYSRSKAAAERIALDLAASDFQVVVLRPRFVWGRDDTTALPALIEAALSGKFAWVGGGNYLTSTTHVANLCVAVDRAFLNGRCGEVYFVSDGAPVEFRAFVSSLLETQGIAVPEKTVPRGVVRTVATIGDLLAKLSGGKMIPPLTMQSYATSAVEISLDISKARRELKYEPIISIDKGLDELRRASDDEALAKDAWIGGTRI